MAFRLRRAGDAALRFVSAFYRRRDVLKMGETVGGLPGGARRVSGAARGAGPVTTVQEVAFHESDLLFVQAAHGLCPVHSYCRSVEGQPGARYGVKPTRATLYAFRLGGAHCPFVTRPRPPFVAVPSHDDDAAAVAGITPMAVYGLQKRLARIDDHERRVSVMAGC